MDPQRWQRLAKAKFRSRHPFLKSWEMETLQSGLKQNLDAMEERDSKREKEHEMNPSWCPEITVAEMAV